MRRLLLALLLLAAAALSSDAQSICPNGIMGCELNFGFAGAPSGIGVIFSLTNDNGSLTLTDDTGTITLLAR